MPDRPTATALTAGRSFRDKRTTLAEAVGRIADGDHVALGGCLYSRTPMALVVELLRQGRSGLTVSRCLTCYEGDLLLASGAAGRVVTSWMGTGARWGSSRVMRELVEGGHAVLEEWSHLGIGLRYKAGAMGVPFLPTRSMLGSDLIGRTGAQVMPCPFTGEPLCLVPAVNPDVALLHVHRADPYGNVQVDGYAHMDADVALSARTVIVSAEEIVPPERITATADRTLLPHFAVDAVVEAPFGAFPHECYGRYDADFEHFDRYAALAREGGAVGARAYIAEYVTGTAGLEGFLDRFGVAALLRGQRTARELVS